MTASAAGEGGAAGGGGGARVATRQQQRGLATRAAAVREGVRHGTPSTPGTSAAPRTRSRAGSITKQPLAKTRGQATRVTATPPPQSQSQHLVESSGTNSASPGSRTRSAQSTRAGGANMEATPTAIAAGQDKDKHNTRFAQQRRPAATPTASQPAATAATPAPSHPATTTPAAVVNAPVSASTRAAAEKASSWPIPANAPPGYRPASAKPPITRVPTFPLVEAYVPDSDPQERRHPRQLLPDELGFPTAAMQGKIQRDDLDDKLLMATCAVLHAFENRALCPKEVAEVMLERDWLKNAGTTPFAHVSTCIRSHVARASQASPPYPPLLVPFELVGALTAEEVRAVGLHAEQRPAVKRGTLWYLNPRVLGPGVGADDPFVRCRREAGLAPSDRDGLYVRGLVPLQHAPPTLPPALSLSSTLFTNTNEAAAGSPDEGDFDEEGMGRGKRKRRASSAMMAAMGREGAKGAMPSPLGSGSSTPVPISAAINITAVGDDTASASPIPTISHRRSQSLGGPSSAPARSGIPKLKFRLSSLEEVDDSDGHTGEAAEWRRRNKKKVRRAGSEGVSRAGSVESTVFDDSSDEAAAMRAMAFSSASSSALLAQSLLAASSLDSAISGSAAPLAPHTTVSPDILSLGPATTTTSFPFSRPPSSRYTLSASAPNIFSHHFANAPSPPDVVMEDSSSSDSSRPATSAGLGALAVDAASPASDSLDDHEEDFHEAMLRGDDFDFEWGSESYSTTGTSSLEASTVAADLLAKAFESRETENTPRVKSRDLAADTASGDDDAAVDTPATTPRSLPQDLEDETSKEESTAAKEDKKPVVEALPSPISRVGMSITLCGEMLPHEEDADVATIKVEEYAKSEESATDLDSLEAAVLPEEERRRLDPVQIPAPPPSPLSLELTPTLALSNAFAATDYDFVGRDEADATEDFGSPSYAYTYDVDVLADDEEGDDEGEIDGDDLLLVKVEDDEAEMAVSSAPSSRAGSALPSTFDARLLATVRASSTTSSSSDSDSFDPMNFVSPSTLATGLPVPQPAPSPPETNDWTISIDMLDDLDLDAASADLMGPETIGLEELDLAWAGDEEDGLSTEPSLEPSSDNNKSGGLSLKVPRSGSATFLTGSTHRFTSPMPSPRRTLSSRLPSFTDLSKDAKSPVPASPTLAHASAAGKVFGAPEFSSSSSVMMEPVIPLEPSVLAIIVQRGIVVFSVEVTDAATGKSMPLLRRLDTDYVNATVLLQAALPSPLERASALAALLVKTDTFRVPSSIADPGVEGTWIPLAAAEDVVATYSKQLGHLAAFFGPDLAAHFPEPVPTMRSSAKNALAQKRHDPNGAVLGSPSFDGAELLRRCGPPSAPRELPSFVHDDTEDIVSAVADRHDAEEQDDAAEEEEEAEEEDRASSTSPPPSRPRRENRSRRTAPLKSTTLEASPPRRSSRRQSTTAR
ncbi:hypothetical protein JCM10908_001234 [Rhodotorula pacifica]|uniref:uncharacterized protein n=1 Tax=Rhodotorula pacifica TaxID=1495444 RepID=UPI00317A5B1F